MVIKSIIQNLKTCEYESYKVILKVIQEMQYDVSECDIKW